MIVLFNNCRCREHEMLFGKNAFFDLNTFGAQASMATNLDRGQKCIVASYDDDGKVRFDWHAFERETLEADPGDQTIKVRVLRGRRLKSETLSKRKAAATAIYARFFNRNGHFKRPSVIKPE